MKRYLRYMAYGVIATTGASSVWPSRATEFLSIAVGTLFATVYLVHVLRED